jgi:hypothetical protein
MGVKVAAVVPPLGEVSDPLSGVDGGAGGTGLGANCPASLVLFTAALGTALV